FGKKGKINSVRKAQKEEGIGTRRHGPKLRYEMLGPTALQLCENLFVCYRIMQQFAIEIFKIFLASGTR
ncbi:MAG: hypothetical protein ACTHKY_18165, partial [Ginsengibacter sp.]